MLQWKSTCKVERHWAIAQRLMRRLVRESTSAGWAAYLTLGERNSLASNMRENRDSVRASY